MKLLLFFLLILATSTTAKSSITLLALTEQTNAKEGVSAQLELETRSGTGRVFLETFPLTQISTQTSMRFAQQIACAIIEEDCTKLDYFYTIKGPPGIVGGPSAGSAATILTIAELKKQPIKKAAITGTVNSGGSIGTVGGIEYKLEAAYKAGIKTVIIPKGTSKQKNRALTIDLIQYGKELGMNVIEASTIEEALPYFIQYEPKKQTQLTISPKYNDIMRQIAIELCENTAPIEEGKYYASASACFRQRITTNQTNMTNNQIQESIKEFEQELAGKNITSMTDVQTIMLVNERIREAKETLQNNTSQTAFAQQRVLSARLWSKFLGTGQPEKIQLEKGCQEKIAEAEERYAYVASLAPTIAQSIRNTVDTAYYFYEANNNIDCLYTAGKAKAEANAIMSVIGIDAENLRTIVETKLNITNKEIAKEQTRGEFPIISYSYYELASSMANQSPTTSLLFTEYALEFAGLNTYVQNKKTETNTEYALYLIGIALLIIALAAKN